MKLKCTQTEPNTRQELLPHAVHEEQMFTDYIQADDGPKSGEGTVTHLQFHKNEESEWLRGAVMARDKRQTRTPPAYSKQRGEEGSASS